MGRLARAGQAEVRAGSPRPYGRGQPALVAPASPGVPSPHDPQAPSRSASGASRWSGPRVSTPERVEAPDAESAIKAAIEKRLELRRRQWHRHAAEAPHPFLHFGVGETGIDLPVGLFDYILGDRCAVLVMNQSSSQAVA
jgi:hypothetical protein